MSGSNPTKGNDFLVQRAGEVRDLVADGQLDRAVQRILDLAREFDPMSSNEAIALSGRYKRLRQKEMLGTADTNDRSALSSIDMVILDLVDSIVRNVPTHQVPADEECPSYGPAPARRDPSTPGAVVLAARDLVKNRRKVEPQFELRVNELDLRLGEITVVIGPNGQGKTTLLEIVAGRLKCDAGTLRYPGLCGDTLDWPTAKARIAYVPHPVKPPRSAEGRPGQSDTTTGGSTTRKEGTVERILRFTAAVYGSVGPENDEQIDWYLERLGLSAYRDTEFSELSSGFQTRVALAAALLKQPRLLIIDEPLANLDTNAQSQVLGQIRDLSGSRKSPFAALISSQHVHLVEAIADRVLFLENGRPRYYGRASDIRANRKRETFELACDLSAAEVQRLLPADCSVIPTGVSLIVHAPRGTAPGLLISTLVARQVTVKYFRSIGDSSRMYFLEADDGRGE